jgi:hypothetical protein
LLRYRIGYGCKQRRRENESYYRNEWICDLHRRAPVPSSCAVEAPSSYRQSALCAKRRGNGATRPLQTSAGASSLIIEPTFSI